MRYKESDILPLEAAQRAKLKWGCYNQEQAKKTGRASWEEVIDEWWPQLGHRNIFNSELMFADATEVLLGSGLGGLQASDYAVDNAVGPQPIKHFDSCRRNCSWTPCCHDQRCDDGDRCVQHL